MPVAHALIECAVPSSFRVAQAAGMFDVPLAEKSRREFTVDVPEVEGDWRIGAIVGPSGSGKTTIARQAFGESLYARRTWPARHSILDAFPKRLSIQEITGTLTAVGFSSPPAWVRPYQFLSNGEQFRCDLARALLTGGELVVFDEFTSVVDRTVAKICSAAVAKAIRKQRAGAKRFVAVTCHYDILNWLTPDWVVDMATCQLARGCLQRPRIELEIVRCDRAAWRLFATHHYLSANLHRSSECFLATWGNYPVAFAAVLPAIGRVRHRRISRLVVLPDFQGVGIGRATLDAVADLKDRQGVRMSITTGHPAMMAALAQSPNWRLVAVEKTGGNIHNGRTQGFTGQNLGSWGRAVARFRYWPARKATEGPRQGA